MKKVFTFSKKKHWFSSEPDLELLNQQLEELQNQGLTVESVTPVANLLGAIDSYVILLSDQK
ncbi:MULTISPECIES: hypothetical protein [Pseudoalteromonas]|uniref:Uncharacterized protein n=1 Tax=Pseudoalteromonas amylolytica TaxID=1859457 RepID=A0A1S1MRU7_9GAMM|nr:MULTISPECIES: hypothetical protein [Pseudoalteromonas]OHU86041.1 hypothetical protein BFC16_15105 [Pseudoalteromonas sp. JW3]OHU89850.1 hypothetical protein BET10_17210 [Pseudoalteromonas amylolytica]